jgi:hypothetical protein
MKKALLFSMAMLCACLTFAQLQEDFDPAPSGWFLSQGAQFQTLGSNGGVITPGIGGNNPAQIGTPSVAKTSNTFEVCFGIWAYTANLNTQIPFPCNTYADVLFVKSTVTNANEANEPENILARVDNHLLPTAGGNTCFNFTFPSTVTDANFKVFISFQPGCNQGGIKYFIDNVKISGVDLICGGTNCPPGASDDVFNRFQGELSFNAVLYGAPIDVSFPAPAPGCAVDATGTDGDQNDTYSHLRWSIVTPPANGTVTISPTGVATITRNSTTVTQITFTYVVCDDGPDDDCNTTADNMCSTPATVTANWPASTLPVTISSFNAARSKNGVTLKWETATEANNTGFEILRNMDNGGYQKIGFVASKASGGSSNTRLNYEFNDVNLSKGVSLYRLKQVDMDGNMQLSEIRSVRGDGAASSITVYPTPSTTGNVTVSVSGLQSYKLSLVDMSGRIIRSVDGNGSNDVKLTNLQSGLYLVKIIDVKTGEQSSEKIVVNKK